MALVASNLNYPVLKFVTFTLAFDSSYPTGGETITAASFGGSGFERVNVLNQGGYNFAPAISADKSTLTVSVYQGSTQVANATDLSALSAVVGYAWIYG